jgi:hypothetical protein
VQNDPDQMTPQERAEKVVALLAMAVLRLHRHPAPTSPARAEDLSATCLEVSAETPLDGDNG